MRRSANALKATLQYLTGDDFFKASKVSRRFAKILCPPVVDWQREFRIDKNCDLSAGEETLRGDERIYAIVEHYKT